MGIGGPHDKFVFERFGPAVKPIGKVGDGKTVLGNELAQPKLVAELVATEREMTMDEGLRRKPILHGAKYRKQSQGQRGSDGAEDVETCANNHADCGDDPDGGSG